MVVQDGLEELGDDCLGIYDRCWWRDVILLLSNGMRREVRFCIALMDALKEMRRAVLYSDAVLVLSYVDLVMAYARDISEMFQRLVLPWVLSRVKERKGSMEILNQHKGMHEAIKDVLAWGPKMRTMKVVDIVKGLHQSLLVLSQRISEVNPITERIILPLITKNFSRSERSELDALIIADFNRKEIKGDFVAMTLRWVPESHQTEARRLSLKRRNSIKYSFHWKKSFNDRYIGPLHNIITKSRRPEKYVEETLKCHIGRNLRESFTLSKSFNV